MPSNGFRSRINIKEKELEAIYLQKRWICEKTSGEFYIDRWFKSSFWLEMSRA